MENELFDDFFGPPMNIPIPTPTPNNVHYIVNIVQQNPLNRIFPIDGVHYRSKYRIDSYPTDCRYDGFNAAYTLEY